MRNPRSPWQPEPDAAASRVHRAIVIYFLLTVVLSAVAFAQSTIVTGVTGIAAGGQSIVPAHNGMFIKEPTGSGSDGSFGNKTITLTMPPETNVGTIKVVLNGKDVSDRFSPANCDNAVCETGTLSSSDGMRPQKNVLYAVAKSEGDKVASSRLRFEGDDSSKSSPSLHAEDASTANPALPTLSSFLPPEVALMTAPKQSGYMDGKPWITVGSQQQYPDASLKCGTQPYSVVVLDRATLVEKTAKPESSPQCFADDPSLTGYLKSMTLSDLVIVATNSGAQTDQHNLKLDTSAIGGTDYSNMPQVFYPTSYFAIGVGGAAPGQAYESYLNPRKSSAYSLPPYATGTLVEDVNGNYNYIPSGTEEFQVAPNDTTYGTPGWIKLGVPPQYVSNGYTTNLALPPNNIPAGIGGYWLLVVDRTSLQMQWWVNTPNWQTPVNGTCVQDSKSYPNLPPSYAVYPNCGTFYPTGDHNAANATQAYLNLSGALNTLKPDQMAILTTIGNPAYGGSNNDPFYVAGTNDGNGYYAYYASITSLPGGGFAGSLTNYGVSPYATMSLMQGDSAFTMISGQTTTPGQEWGNPLTGSAVVSSTFYSQQGQTGYVHGVFTPDRFGYFRPGRTSQEQSFATDSSNFQMAVLTNQRPSDWPEFTTLLTTTPGGSVAGQTQAYRYASYLLISNYYLRNSQGHQDDLHFFYNGSLNTLIDYRVFDPANLTLPQAPTCSPSGAQITCNFPAALGLQPATFTQADFDNVKAQLSAEVVDLTNVLTYLSTGSDNLKDVVAAGQANTALAMIGAAATVEASSLAPKPTAPVQVNASNILGMVGGVTGIISEIASLAPGAGTIVSAVVGVVSDALYISSSVTGGLSQGSTSIPNPNFAFETTLGQLANNQLIQGQMSVGFDAMADGILSDWNKLSQLGQLVTDTTNPGFYLPDQVSQNAALTLINQGTQRSLMLSLLPSMYQVHYWAAVGGYNQDGGSFLPAFGYTPNEGYSDTYKCDAFYAYNPPVWSSYRYYPSPIPMAVSPFHLNGFNLPGESDQYILSLPMTDKGTDKEMGQESDDALNQQLFGNGSGQLNLPFDLMVMPNGAMDRTLLGTSSIHYMSNWQAETGFYINQLCIESGLSAGPDAVNTLAVGNPSPTPTSISTTTTLTVPASAVVGDSVTLSAKVTSASGTIPNGTVLFYQDEKSIGQGTLDATGTTTLPSGSVALGSYTYIARYVANQTYNTSTSNSASLTVYQAPPSMTLFLSAQTLQVSYGATSAPVTIQISSTYGMAGPVTFSCTGLPVGMRCNFSPAQASIAAGANTTTSLTISASAAQAAGLPWLRGVGAILLFPLSLLCLWRIRRGAARLQAFLCFLLLSALSVGYLTGCGGGGTKSQPLQETGAKTVLVNATSGSFTQSVPIVLNIQ